MGVTSTAAQSAISGVAIALLGAGIALGQGPVHVWSFEFDVVDDVGTADPVLMNGASVVDGKVVLDGPAEHVEVPIAATLAAASDLTVLGWWTCNTCVNQTWARLFDFGSSTSSYIMVAVKSFDSPQGIFFEIRQEPTQENMVWTSIFPSGVETCAALTIDSATTTATLYLDGQEKVSSDAVSLRPQDLSEATSCWLGRSHFSTDPYFTGTIAEVRVYDTALPADEIEKICACGPRSGLFADSFEAGYTDCWSTAVASIEPLS